MKVVDLFAGCGGLSLGLQIQGFDIVCAYENWPEAAKVYRDNFYHPVFEEDLSQTQKVVQQIQKYKPDMIAGGPPCQDFSHAGKRTEGGNADLTIEFAKIISSVLPNWFLMENVERIYKSFAYRKAREIYKSSGYGLTEIVLDASFCNVPQKRRRFFCVGKKEEKDCFLVTFLEKLLSTKALTVREYMGDELDFEYYYRHPRNYNRRGIFSIDEPAPTIRGVNRPIPRGYTGHMGDPVSVAKARVLNTMERARLQTFPKSFKWSGTKTALEQMIGNAVPVNLASLVGCAIKDFISQECKNKKRVA